MPNPKADPKVDPTPVLAQQVIELYADALADVRFPDVDLAALQASRVELQRAQLALERVESELAAARSGVEAASQALCVKAERALSYARVFAQGDTALALRVAEIGRKKPLPSTDAKREGPRARKRKASAPNDLFSEHAPPASEEALA